MDGNAEVQNWKCLEKKCCVLLSRWTLAEISYGASCVSPT